MQPNVLEFLSDLVRYPSITPDECGIYELICAQLPDFEVLHIDKGGVKNLFLYKRFGEPASKALHFCFAGHIDVVPPGQGWGSDPFNPTLKEGYLYARGTQDMKSGVAAFVCALRDCIKDFANLKTPLILSVLLTSDEEGCGTYGTKIVLEVLEEKNLLPDMALVGEPTCTSKIGDNIKIGRRGSINGIINLKGVQGHVAYPEKCINPIELLGSKLGLLAGVNLDNGDEHFDASKLVITDIRGGMEAVNVTPGNVKIMFNVRNSTHTNLQSVQAYVENVLSGLEYDLDIKTSSQPFLTNAHCVLAQSLCEVVSQVCCVHPCFSTSGGTSDARHFANFGVEVVEFGVINDRIHSVDERVSIKDLNILYEVYLNLIMRLKDKDEK
ncbi:succinyl-diaminopimelate desuccinylase [Helicobacter sp. 11S03491-1]|uniref:succinyl-diaminopimelate desuccinylase n=1 Tax=Helicobacter sp. 11S03491-1 TaxID=1476196 RepID=UPI000BA50A04|nr:succinyl-diaminopimelate desuccinylase [Helicobacter sp. 11S03491-1]PAF41831.1 succinyl-diaminopimelate desuccinylase [Helicobacter sp. 11S03491-1]